MDFYLYARDENFDYQAGQLPDDLLFKFGDQLNRARAILGGRSAEELSYALESLDWLLRQGSERFMAEVMAGAYGDEVFVERVKALRAFAPHFDLTDQSAFPNATWADYFAVLALACVGEELYVRKTPEPSLSDLIPPDEHARQLNEYRWASALEAMEAVCFAEQLRSEEELRKQIEQLQAQAGERFRQAGKRGAQIRLAPFDQLRARLLAHYDEHLSKRSNRGAAKLLYERFQSDVDAVLRTDDPAQRIAIWIGQHKKGRR